MDDRITATRSRPATSVARWAGSGPWRFSFADHDVDAEAGR